MVSGETGDNSGAEKDVFSFSSAQFSVDRRRRRRRRHLDDGRRRRSRGEERRAEAEAVAPYLIPPILHAAVAAARLRANRSVSELSCRKPGGRGAGVRAGRPQCVASVCYVSWGRRAGISHPDPNLGLDGCFPDCYLRPVVEWYSSLGSPVHAANTLSRRNTADARRAPSEQAGGF